MACTTIQATAQKAMVYWVGQHIWLSGYSPMAVHKGVTAPTSLAMFIATCIHPDTRWVIEDFTTSDNGVAIAAALTQGKCVVAVSYSSFKNEFGMARLIVIA
jgi:hypothetical protein